MYLPTIEIRQLHTSPNEKGCVLVDVLGRRKPDRVAANVNRVCRLIHTDPIDAHGRREGEVLEVDEAEVLGHAEVQDEVLSALISFIVSRRTWAQ